MKPKEFIQRLKDLKIRRFEKNEYAKSIGGGTGLTGNILDDWVTAVTQGEYTKYEDIPVGVLSDSGNLGWRRVPATFEALTFSAGSMIFVDRTTITIVRDGVLKEPVDNPSIVG